MVENANTPEVKDVELIVDQGQQDHDHPCAQCANDPHGGPNEGCSEFQCSGCLKPEEYEERDRLESEAKRVLILMAEAFDRVAQDIAKCGCIASECATCPMQWTTNLVYTKSGKVVTTSCMSIFARQVLVPHYPNKRMSND